MTNRKFPTEQELNQLYLEAQQEFVKAKSLNDMTYRDRFLSATQQLVLEIRETKAEMQLLKGTKQPYAMSYLQAQLEELRTGYKSAKEKDLKQNEFNQQAYAEAGKNTPTYLINVIADWE